MSQVLLDKVKFAVRGELAEEFAAHDVDVEIFAHQVVATVRWTMLGKEHPDKVVRYPSDWWQAFKERWFPTWATRRWPVRYTSHRATVKELYPNIKASIPGQQVAWWVETDDSWNTWSGTKP